MSGNGAALRMKLELAALARKFNVAPPQPKLEPLLPECDEHACRLFGLASTYAIDYQRQRLRKFALSWLPWKLPQLQFRHEGVEIGTVDLLEYRDGGIYAAVTTSHPMAMRAPAFSIGADVLSYRIENADSPDFHAVVESALVTELSLTPIPACPGALVFERWPANCDRFHELMIRKVELLRQCLQISGGPRP